jgi:hypothetical protein
MKIFSWLLRDYKAVTVNDSPDVGECINVLIEEGRNSTYGWNSADAAKLEALWSSGRFPKPSVSFNDQGEVFVSPELAKELHKPGNEGITALLLSMATLPRPAGDA